MTRWSLALLVLLALVSPVQAAIYYTDSSCMTNGNGSTNNCANGATGPINSATSLQTLLASGATTGDTIFIKGDFTTTNGSGAYDAGFAVHVNGINILVATGTTGTLRNCAAGSTTQAACDRVTLALWNVSNVHVDGLTIVGSIGVHSDVTTAATLKTGNQLTNISCSVGYASADDGNWSCFYIERQSNIVLRNLTCTSIAKLTGSGAQSSAACVKVYSSFDGTFEYLTCRNLNVDESASGCFDDKEASVRNTWRYLWCQDAPACFRLQNQRGTLDATVAVVDCNLVGNERACGYAATGTLVEHAVFWKASWAGTLRDCVRLEAGDITDFTVRKITCVGFSNGLQELTPNTGLATDGIQVYSSIFASLANSLITSFGDDSDITKLDFNCYDSDLGWALDSNHSTLAGLVSATPFEDHGVETASSFGFANEAGGNFHLSGGSCVGHGSSNGTAVNDIDPGAYSGSVRCVGYGCGKPTNVTGN